MAPKQDTNARLLALHERLSPRLYEVPFEELSVPERVFRLVWELEAQVNNGGFEQYVFNDSGALAPFAADALRSIGAERMAMIVDSALATLGSLNWTNRDDRHETLLAMTDEAPDLFHRFDQRFYEYPDDLTEFLARYVSEHRDQVSAFEDF